MGIIYTCHPTKNFTIGPYTFADSTLTLSEEEAVAFDELHSKMPAHEQNQIRKISVDAAEALIAKLTEEKGPVALHGTDSAGAGAALQRLQNRVPKVGTKPLENSQPAAESAQPTGDKKDEGGAAA